MPSSISRLLACLTTIAVVSISADQLPNQDNNASISLSFNSTFSERALTCTQPPNAVQKWYYDSAFTGPFTCTMLNDNHGQWAMLNAYRSGGKKNYHWMYTNDENDRRCLENWTYYGKSGKDVIAHITGRTTMHSDKKRWCPLRSYQQGGLEGKQWAYCDCEITGV